MTTAEAAKELDLTPMRVRQLCQSGILPARKIGRDWLIRRGDLPKAAKRAKPGRPPRS